MIRSLIAVIIAVVAGLAAARLVEIIGIAASDGAESGLRLVLLLAGWGVGAFVAGVIALLIARRWAPVGWLAAGTIFFQAFMTLMGGMFSPAVWLAAAGLTGAGGFAAVKLLRARYGPPPRAGRRP